MKWIACLALVAACQHGGDGNKPSPGTAELPRAPLSAEYKQDITNLCDVLHLSGADQLPPGDRAPSIAMWLGPNIKTEAGHDFLVAIQPLVGRAEGRRRSRPRPSASGCRAARSRRPGDSYATSTVACARWISETAPISATAATTCAAVSFAWKYPHVTSTLASVCIISK